jgi:hypothetical protein
VVDVAVVFGSVAVGGREMLAEMDWLMALRRL